MPHRPFTRLALTATIAVVSILRHAAAAPSAEEAKLPPRWAIDGFVAAFEDGTPKLFEQQVDFGVEHGFWAALRPRADGLVPRVAARLRDTDPSVRSAAARALGALGAKERAAILVELLHDPAYVVRYAAVEALGALKVREQAGAVAVLLGNPKRDVQLAAVTALGALGAREHAGAVAAFLHDQDERARSTAAWVLGTLGAREHARAVAALVADPRSGVRYNVARTLGALGARNEAGVLVGLLRDPDGSVRSAAAEALGAIGAREHAGALIALLRDPGDDPDGSVRIAAGQALGAVGAHEQIEALTGLLRDTDAAIRSTVARVFGAAGMRAGAEALTGLLRDQEAVVRAAAAEALVAVGDREQIGKVAALLGDEDGHVQFAAVRALRVLGAGEHMKALVEFLGRQNDDPLSSPVRAEAVASLGTLGAKEHAGALARLLGDPDALVRGTTAWALGVLGAREYAGAVAALLGDEDRHGRSASLAAVLHLGPFGLETTTAVMASIYNSPRDRAELRLAAHLLGAGDPDAEMLLSWVGLPPTPPILEVGLADGERARRALESFVRSWAFTLQHPKLRDDLANQIAGIVAKSCSTPAARGDEVGARIRSLWGGAIEWIAGVVGAACWSAADRDLLVKLRDQLRGAGLQQADTVEKAISLVDRWGVLGWALLTGGGHILFWGLLLGAYPWSWAQPVRAFFFWNPWPRRILGLLYVGFLLAYVPWLRRLLFVPYRRSLLVDADLEHFSKRAYFAGNRAIDERGAVVPLDRAVPEVKGQIVLEGDSGLGKSLFLRRLAKRSRRIAVYMPARRCEGGVIEAVQAKLPGFAGDPDFLRQIVSAGAVDVIIDGLNEVSAETRGKITDFVERHFEGNIILATQSMEWRKPANARTLRLLPLARDEVEVFLVSREVELLVDAPLKGEAFIRAARVFLARAFDSYPEGTAERVAMQRALANPMDLVTVAQILATGREPDLLALQEQAYALMAEDYAATNQGAAFPLERFAEHVYELRSKDSKAPSEAEFPNEVAALERHKMLVRRVGGDRQGPVVFRHDKVMEFFLYHAFLGRKRAERQTRHVGDPRFRGVYLLMALRLPLADAQALKELVVDHSADTGDHSLSDELVRLMRDRGRARRPAEVRPGAAVSAAAE